jgi:hypothetical protein
MPFGSDARKEQAGGFPEAPFRSIAGDGIADPPAGRESQPDVTDTAGLWARAGLQDESRRNPAPAGRGNRQEFGAMFEANDPSLGALPESRV